jgi:hypothetical protein
MDLKEIGREVMEWIHLAEDKEKWRGLANTGSVRGREFLD